MLTRSPLSSLFNSCSFCFFAHRRQIHKSINVEWNDWNYCDIFGSIRCDISKLQHRLFFTHYYIYGIRSSCTHTHTRALTETNNFFSRYCPFNFRSIKLMFNKLTFRAVAGKKKTPFNQYFVLCDSKIKKKNFWPSYRISTFNAINYTKQIHSYWHSKKREPNWKRS